MAIKIGLSNGETIIYSTEETVDDILKKFNDAEDEDRGIDILGREIRVHDILYFKNTTKKDNIEEALAAIQKKSHELSFNRGRSTKGSYMVPVYVSVEFDEENGVVKDIRLDGMKEHLMKNI